MVDVVREIERKYEAEAGTELRELPAMDRLPGVAATADTGPVALDATYYDTEDGRLAAHRTTLRRRVGGGDEGWHLKLPADPRDPGVRDEIRAPLADELPRELAALVRSRVRGAPLVPLMRLCQRRTARELRDAAGTPLAEVSVDEVSAERYGPAGTTAEWTEVEAELAPGQDPALLDAVDELLRAAGLRSSASPSKLRRALDATAWQEQEERPRPPAKRERAPKGEAPGTAADVVLAYVRTQVDAIVELDPAVRRDVPDSVHRMRVATRRLRSAFRSYGRVLDRAVTDPVGAELKWLAAELGVDRDREVLTARLAERLDEVPRSLRLGPVTTRLRTFSQARRTGSRRHLLAVLDGGRYLALLDRLDALLAGPPLHRKTAERPAAGVVEKALRRDFDRLARGVGEALASGPGAHRDLAVHEARKAAKRARYAAEAARPALGKPAKQFAGQMTELQELLGDHQDSVVARAALRDLAAQAHAAGEPSFTYGLAYAREQAIAAEREAQLPGLWSRITRYAGGLTL
ncbi:CYTH and CHAD domain-containing protein [Streptomyces boncukensis]|uniref:CYTH and CHAD domain-containing protein n=1 Tax=Streptomyces boncukensis TaxID=2711219 RepID=A0A6G4WXG5_9ACTN|nr:CYTH and CHAD domain-containing protein [Streptomyces boncukensis]NGO69320.1 CYTH and CHAD domain-containing protein [Streptomyces boncukensis]